MRLRRLRLDEIAAINRKRDEDLARLAAGWTPTAEDLKDAPTLSHWVEYMPVGGSEPALIGHVKGHPHVLDGWAHTDQILARGPGWVRTHSTFLRLGPEAPPRPHMEPRPAEEVEAPAASSDPDADGLLDHLPAYSQPGPWGR